MLTGINNEGPSRSSSRTPSLSLVEKCEKRSTWPIESMQQDDEIVLGAGGRVIGIRREGIIRTDISGNGTTTQSTTSSDTPGEADARPPQRRLSEISLSERRYSIRSGKGPGGQLTGKEMTEKTAEVIEGINPGTPPPSNLDGTAESNAESSTTSRIETPTLRIDTTVPKCPPSTPAEQGDKWAEFDGQHHISPIELVTGQISDQDPTRRGAIVPNSEEAIELSNIRQPSTSDAESLFGEPVPDPDRLATSSQHVHSEPPTDSLDRDTTIATTLRREILERATTQTDSNGPTGHAKRENRITSTAGQSGGTRPSNATTLVDNPPRSWWRRFWSFLCGKCSECFIGGLE